jgi:hypothetical protein
MTSWLCYNCVQLKGERERERSFKKDSNNRLLRFDNAATRFRMEWRGVECEGRFKFVGWMTTVVSLKNNLSVRRCYSNSRLLSIIRFPGQVDGQTKRT